MALFRFLNVYEGPMFVFQPLEALAAIWTSTIDRFRLAHKHAMVQLIRSIAMQTAKIGLQKAPLDVQPNSPLKFRVHLRGLDWFPCGMKDGLQFCR